MLRRCQFLLVSLAVCVASVLPSFAWSEESFIGKDKLEEFGYYEADPVADSPMMMMVARPFAVVDDSSIYSHSFSDADLFSLISPDFSALVSYGVKYDGYNAPGAGVSIPGYTSFSFYPSEGSLPIYSHSYSGTDYFEFFQQFSGVLPAPSSEYFHNLYLEAPYPDLPNVFRYSFDLSSLGDFSSFALSGRLFVYSNFVVDGSSRNAYGGDINLYVNGQLVEVFHSNSSGYVDFADFLYSSSVPITSIYFSVEYPLIRFDFDSDSYDIPHSFSGVISLMSFDLSPFSFSILKGDISLPPSGMQDADNTLGDYDSVEDRYFDDAESAVGGLDTTVPDGMLGSAAMIGGMFNDLWTVLGDFSLIYFIPLLFSFFLWIIGRKRGDSG